MSETEVKIIDQVEENAKIDLEDLMRKYDTEERFRALTGWQGQLVALLAVAMSCFHFYTSGFGLLLAQMQGAVHLAFTLALVFLLYPATSKQSKTSGIPFYDYILAGLGVASSLYLVFFFNDLVMRAGLPTTTDLVMGFILIATLLEATRRIRGLNRPDARTVPIFAMTANAFADDAERSRSAGMNEHLTKPIDAAVLTRTIARYVRGRETNP